LHIRPKTIQRDHGVKLETARVKQFWMRASPDKFPKQQEMETMDSSWHRRFYRRESLHGTKECKSTEDVYAKN